MKRNRVKTSLMFLTMNRLGTVVRCFHSLAWTLNEPGLEWIILDNASTDGTAAWLQKLSARYNSVHVILSAANLGVAGGRRALLERASGARLLFLDSDVASADRKWLPDLLAAIRDPKVGVAGPAGHWITEGWRWYERVDLNFKGPVDTVSGYCQAFRRNVASKLEIDVAYSPYWQEDTDYCMQAKALGLEIMQIPCPGLQHMYAGTGASTEDGFIKQRYLANKWSGRGLVRFEREGKS